MGTSQFNLGPNSRKGKNPLAADRNGRLSDLRPKGYPLTPAAGKVPERFKEAKPNGRERKNSFPFKEGVLKERLWRWPGIFENGFSKSSRANHPADKSNYKL